MISNVPQRCNRYRDNILWWTGWQKRRRWSSWCDWSQAVDCRCFAAFHWVRAYNYSSSYESLKWSVAGLAWTYICHQKQSIWSDAAHIKRYRVFRGLRFHCSWSCWWFCSIAYWIKCSLLAAISLFDNECRRIRWSCYIESRIMIKTEWIRQVLFERKTLFSYKKVVRGWSRCHVIRIIFQNNGDQFPSCSCSRYSLNANLM